MMVRLGTLPSLKILVLSGRDNKKQLISKCCNHYYIMAEAQSPLLRHQFDRCTQVPAVEVDLGNSYFMHRTQVILCLPKSHNYDCR